MSTTIQFLNSWNGYEVGAVHTLSSDSEAARLVAAGLARLASSMEPTADQAGELNDSEKLALQALVSGAWKTCPNTLDASVTYETTQLSVAAGQTVTLALAGVAALPPGGISLDVPAGGAGATLAFSGGALHDASSASITLDAGSTYAVRPSPTAGVVYVTGGARL